MNDKAIAKSLHTITVLQQVARLHMDSGMDKVRAMESAMEVLGLAGRPDPHGLAEKAIRLMA